MSEEGGSFLSDVSDEGTEYTPIPSGKNWKFNSSV